MDALRDPWPPYLWGDWRCSTEPDFFVAECQACGGELWMHWDRERWRLSCESGCTYGEIDRAARWQELLKQARYAVNDEAGATMEPDDPLYAIDAAEYIEALTGREVDRRGFACCPFHSGGDERTPSLHATGPLWFCHGCHTGGTVYDFAGRLWDQPPRGHGFIELRDRVREELIAWGS